MHHDTRRERERDTISYRLYHTERSNHVISCQWHIHICLTLQNEIQKNKHNLVQNVLAILPNNYLYAQASKISWKRLRTTTATLE